MPNEGPQDCTRWVVRHMIKLKQTMEELKMLKAELGEKNAYIETLESKVKELEGRLASRIQEIRLSSN